MFSYVARVKLKNLIIKLVQLTTNNYKVIKMFIKRR